MHPCEVRSQLLQSAPAMQSNTLLGNCLSAGDVETRFQPIFEIAAAAPPRPYAFEAVSRGWPGTPFADSSALFAAVRREGREQPADRLCMSLAVTAGSGLAPSRLAINVHAHTLANDTSFPALLRDCCARHGIPLERVILELIDNHDPSDVDSALRHIERLRSDGAALALYSAGNGTSALRLLRAASPDLLKIDRKHIACHPGRPDRRFRRLALMQRIATRYGALAVAEGVETAQDLAYAREAGIPLAQGDLLGGPASAEYWRDWKGLIVGAAAAEATQANIARSRNEWCATVDAVRDMILLEDPRGRILRCNLATARFLKMPFQAIVGLDLSAAFFGPAAAGTVHAAFRCEQTTVQFADGPAWFEISNFPLPDQARGGASWVHTVVDVSARRRAEEEGRRLSAAVEQTGEMLLIVSRKGELQYANPAYCNAAGSRAAQLLGRQAFALPLAPRQGIRPILSALVARGAWQGTFSSPGPDGAVHEIDATVSPVRAESGETTSFVCVARDVTEARRLESIADAVNMCDQVGFVFAALRHELGNPVNSIKTALSVLHRNLADYSQADVSLYLERTLAEVARMEYLLRSFKSFGAFERPRLSNVAAAGHLDEFVALVRGDMERRGIRIESQIEADLGLACIDPRAFNQALLNLLTNAADAVAGRDEPCVRIVGQRRGRRIEVRVEDNGIGVAEADIANLFKPFFTTKSGGTGLGLAIVRKMLSKMSATIDVRSERGVGTVFTLSLAAASEAP